MPPALPLAALGFRHVAVMCRYIVTVALVLAVAKLPQDAGRNALGLCMIAVAFLAVRDPAPLPVVTSRRAALAT